MLILVLFSHCDISITLKQRTEDVDSDNEKEQRSSYIPATDANGLRKTYSTPEFVGTSEPKKRGIQPKYPWAAIKVGESFEVLHSEMKKKSLDPFVSRMAKKIGKKFKITDCPDYGIYLISCVSMTEEQASQTSNNVVEALDKVDGPKNIFEAIERGEK